MPIKGKIPVEKEEEYVEKMTVGEIRYIDTFSIMVTKKAIFIDIYTSVVSYEEKKSWEIPIKRIGEGLTENDFELDFSNLDSNYTLSLDNNITYYNLVKEKDCYIVFYNFSLNIINRQEEEEGQEVSKKTELETKEEELKKALALEDYEKAGKLRNEIQSLKTKKRK